MSKINYKHLKDIYAYIEQKGFLNVGLEKVLVFNNNKYPYKWDKTDFKTCLCLFDSVN